MVKSKKNAEYHFPWTTNITAALLQTFSDISHLPVIFLFKLFNVKTRQFEILCAEKINQAVVY